MDNSVGEGVYTSNASGSRSKNQCFGIGDLHALRHSVCLKCEERKTSELCGYGPERLAVESVGKSRENVVP
jgi:hypothetical protein